MDDNYIERLGEDFAIAHNPVFEYQDNHPYKLDQLLAIFCEDGSADGSVNLQRYHIEKNGFLIILPQHIMEASFVSKDFKGTHIYMSERFLANLNIGDAYQFYESVERKPYFQLKEQMAEGLRQYINMAYNILTVTRDHPNAEECVRLITKAFFLMLGWVLHKDVISPDAAGRQGEITNEFLELVRKNYPRHRDVDYYAGKMNMTPKYMSTVVKRASGKSALQWIEDYVILDAKAQLSSSRKSIQEIAWNLQFDNQSFFGRYFKRGTGLSPSEYRRKYRR